VNIEFLIGYLLRARPPGRSVKKLWCSHFIAALTGQFIGRPGGHRSCFVAMAPRSRCQAPSFVIDGVRCQPRRSKRAAWDNLIEVGNAGWRDSDAVAPSFLVKVRVGESQREAVQQHPKFGAAIARAGAEAGAGAAGCKLSETADGEAGKAGCEAGGADDATIWTLKAMRWAARQMGRRQLT